jgi:hypothetical protein
MPDHLRVPASVTGRKRSTPCLHRGAANDRSRRKGDATRPGDSRRPPLTSGLRPIPAVRMSTGEGVKSTGAEQASTSSPWRSVAK